MALNTTPGDASQDSYATLAEFNSYAENRLPVIAGVATATDAEKEAAMRHAARSLDANFDWTGSAVDAVQALTWPRSGMFTRNGFAIASSGAESITKPLKDAQCELAYQLLGGANLTGDNDAEKFNVSSVKAGSVAVSFQSTESTNNVEAADIAIRRMQSEFNYVSLAIPGEVRRLLVPSWFEQPTMQRPFDLEAM
jgi:hypothetical protein